MSALLDAVVAVRGDETAVVDERGSTTWRDLDRRVTRLIHALRSRGAGTGDRVVVLLGNQIELIELSLACAQGGWVLVPVNWHSVAREVAYVLDDAEPVAIVADHRWIDVAAEALGAATTPVAVRLAVGGTDRDGWEPYEAAVAEGPDVELTDAVKGGPMFYTSGTTGHPKGVRSVLTSVGGPPELFTLIAHSMGPTIGVPPIVPGAPPERRVQLVCGPMYHAAQWVFGVFTLLCGATVVLQHRFDADELLDLVDRHGVTNVHLVPTQMARLLDLPPARREQFDGSTLQTVIHGAAPCPPALKRAAIEWWGPSCRSTTAAPRAGSCR